LCGVPPGEVSSDVVQDGPDVVGRGLVDFVCMRKSCLYWTLDAGSWAVVLMERWEEGVEMHSVDLLVFVSLVAAS